MRYIEYGITISEKDLIGRIGNFPLEIVYAMAANAAKQGNNFRNSIITFADCPSVSKDNGGFDWGYSPEGMRFWGDVINHHLFKVYFEKYSECKGTYVMEKSDDFPWIKPEMPKELVQLIIRTAIIQGKRNQLKSSSVAGCFPWADTLQGWDFWNDINSGDYSVFTLSIKTNKNETQLQRKESNFVRGAIPEGSILCGKKGKSSITVGPLSFRECIGQ